MAQPHLGGVLRLRALPQLPEPVASHRHPLLPVTLLHTRGLFAYPNGSSAPVPDLAESVERVGPTAHLIRLRADVRWDTSPARAVTAHDVVRGLKRLCAPHHTSTALPYFLSTIRGMAAYRDGHPTTLRTAADLAEHAATHDIAGVRALDERTVLVELLHPAAEFADLLALPCAAPAPAEYDAFLPDSREARHNLRSTGPYRVALVAGDAVRLEHNPAWRADSDPVRARVPGSVLVSELDDDPHLDLTGERVVGRDERSPLLGVDYLALNPRGPLRDRVVRAAVAGAVRRGAHWLVPPDAGALPDDAAPPERGPLLLPPPLTLTMIHPDTPEGYDTAVAVAAELMAAGLDVLARALPQAEHAALLADRSRAEAGEWDLLLGTWLPDWARGNARAFLLPLCHSTGVANPGGHGLARADALVEAALAAQDDPERAGAAAREAQRLVLDEAVVVPLRHRRPLLPHARADVRNLRVLGAFGGVADLSAVLVPEQCADERAPTGLQV
ncbi:hypothetical protein KCV87_05460 [Actinosynnema pretiosum subsp. pretiosum]|uniref:Solute-binding protein family 5 domain-containing protein n=1 Tax=Actinosynnema pretiosum subsp. pretiosum TaxID=103721 RepID=A0AA45L910_9PSEU|nr:Oligopeptide ABC transporter, periplasmic oligopeptide-binding protein OppA [Actinosynnema pretiosum subsp. pretiosum]QUF05546.1 hypothetical protein KCV87_05460 [Actinosynnema pretiosum subsp. pretiosum]